MRLYVLVLDTEVVSSFIQKAFISIIMWDKIKPSPNINLRNVNNRNVHKSGTINLAAEIGNLVEIINFNIV